MYTLYISSLDSFWRCQSNERDGDDKKIVETPSVGNGGLSRVERRGL